MWEVFLAIALNKVSPDKIWSLFNFAQVAYFNTFPTVVTTKYNCHMPYIIHLFYIFYLYNHYRISQSTNCLCFYEGIKLIKSWGQYVDLVSRVMLENNVETSRQISNKLQ